MLSMAMQLDRDCPTLVYYKNKRSLAWWGDLDRRSCCIVYPMYLIVWKITTIRLIIKFCKCSASIPFMKWSTPPNFLELKTFWDNNSSTHRFQLEICRESFVPLQNVRSIGFPVLMKNKKSVRTKCVKSVISHKIIELFF